MIVKRRSVFLAVAALSGALACFSGPAFSQISPAFNDGIIEKNVYFVGKGDVIVRGVFGDTDCSFVVPEFVKVADATVVANFSHAKELLPDLSSLTVYFNGRPLSSVFLTPENADDFRLTLKIDPKDFITGVNTIRFTFFMRSLRTPCADMDNPINWSILHNASFVNIKFRIAQALPVRLFSEAFCKSGPLFSDDTAFLLVNDADEHMLQAAAILANYLGRAAGRARNMRFFYKNEAPAEQLGKYNIIALGKGDARETLVSLAWSQWAKDKFVFSITGRDTAAIEKAALYMANYDTAHLSKDVETFSVKVLESARPKPRKMAPAEGTFKEMGYPDIVLSGVFSRKTSFGFARPANWKLEDGRVKFVIQYSSFLIPETSGATIEINGTPVASRKFVGNPDRPLVITTKIPPAMLESKYFYVAANLFLDIGQKDCNHQFKDKAWAVIRNSSRLLLAHRHRSYKDLSDFPSMIMKGENLVPSTIAVPDKPRREILALVMTLFSTIGAGVPGDINIPLIKKASSVKADTLKKTSVIAIGDPADFKWYTEADGSLPVKYDSVKGSFTPKELLPNISFDGSYGAMQIAPSPWNRRGIFAIFSAGGSGYGFLSTIMSESALYAGITGDFTYASGGDTVRSFNLQLKPVNRVPDFLFIALWLLLVAAFAAVVAGIYLLVTRRKK